MSLTDADSIMCNTETENVNEEFYKGKELFDFSNDPKIKNITILQIT